MNSETRVPHILITRRGCKASFLRGLPHWAGPHPVCGCVEGHSLTPSTVTGFANTPRAGVTASLHLQCRES